MSEVRVLAYLVDETTAAVESRVVSTHDLEGLLQVGYRLTAAESSVLAGGGRARRLGRL